MFEIIGLTKDYRVSSGKFRALSDISFKLPNTGLIALFGENGCGKTTLLNVISTLDTDYKGRILYDGKDIRKITEEYRREVVSVVLQENIFADYMTVKDNICLFSDENDETVVFESLEKYKIREKADEIPQHLSGGQKQRASLIRGMSKKFNVLIVDEPTSSLNEQMEQEVFEKLKDISREKLVILVSHNKSLIRQYSDMILHMENGEIKKVETNKSQRIEYLDNEVRFPEHLTSFAFVDINSVKQIINKSGKAVFSYSTDEKNDYNPDYEIKEFVLKKKKKKIPASLRKCLHRQSSRNSLSVSILGGLLIAFLAILLALSSSFAFFEPYSFMYDSLKSNYNERIEFEYGSILADDPFFETTKIFNRSSYKYLINKLDSDILIRKKNDGIDTSVESCGIYSNKVSGLLYCIEEKTELLAGKYSGIGEIMISDYLADGFIASSSTLHSYSDIISNGIELNGIVMKVSGIVDTGYKKYVNNESGALSVTESDEYVRAKESILEAIYCPFDGAMDNKYLNAIPLLNESIFTVLASESEILNSTDLKQGECKINRKVAEFFASLGIAEKEIEPFKTNGGIKTVVGTVDDGTDDYRIYLNSDDFKEETNTLFAEGTTSLINLSNINQLKELETHNMHHKMPSSEGLYNTIIIINKLKESFVLILVTIAALILLCAAITCRQINRQDNVVYAFMKMSSFSRGESFGLLFVKTSLMALFSSCLSVLMYCGGSVLLNKVLSSLFESEIVLFRIIPLSLILCIGSVFAGVMMFTVIIWGITQKKDIIKLLNSKKA